MTQDLDAIELFGVKTNNLKNIDCRIPLNQFTVLTGVSGSGKSSLAFDTLYAEGQRRFFEAMSTYSRMFLDEMPKPPIDRIENCLPALALRQQSSYSHPRSNVATVSEILFYLSQIFANAGELTCLSCGGKVGVDDEKVIHERLAALGDRLKIILYAKVELIEGESAASRLEALAALGYQRLWIDQTIVELAEADVEKLLRSRSFNVLIDRLVFKNGPELDPRMSEALEEAFRMGDGKAYMDILGDQPTTVACSKAFACQKCGEVYPSLRVEMFDPNSTIGACSVCTGFGMTAGIDWKKVIAPARTLLNDAIRPFATPSKHQRRSQLLAFCERQNIPVDVPFNALTPEQRELVKFGKPPYKGVAGFFEYLQSNSNKFLNRLLIAKYRGYSPCQSCQGTGLSPVSRYVRFLNKTFHEIMSMTLAEARDFFDAITPEFARNTGLETPIEEVQFRLRTLCQVGLGYLTLDRRTKTLSGGESQRLHLGCGLGRGLTDTLYVLDEPTAGLHPRDSLMLANVIESLRDMGNTLVVVEHDVDIIQHADHVIELGPKAGDDGGEIIFEGDVKALHDSDTPTGRMMRKQDQAKPYDVAFDQACPINTPIQIIGAYANNLQNIDVEIPTGRLVTIAGVSGSGKSSLVSDVLYAWVQLNQAEKSTKMSEEENENSSENDMDESISPLCNDIRGLDQFDEIVMMQQQSVGRSARSSILTVTRAFTEIRDLFAKQQAARDLGLTASCFSFNAPSGRCLECEGLGYQTIEMMFMSDIRKPCPACKGRRYNDDVLSVTFNGKTIADVTDMSVAEAMQFFSAYPHITQALQSFMEVGLDYVHLGQPSSELSGGEYQRFRLAMYLDRPRMKDTLFIFDEPTVGLHMQDVECLLRALNRIVKAGASVIVVEHNLDFIAQSHYVIELGPEAGPEGGNIVFCGTPAQLMRENTLTAQALRNTFEHV